MGELLAKKGAYLTQKTPVIHLLILPQKGLVIRRSLWHVELVSGVPCEPCGVRLELVDIQVAVANPTDYLDRFYTNLGGMVGCAQR